MANYGELNSTLKGLVSGIPYNISNLSNAAALLYHGLEDINWAGFYLLKEGKLVLGPFQGKPACIVIPIGRGVCGTAAKSNETLLVADVHTFAGHIACDAASASEIVIPILRHGELFGVLDIDSPKKGRFTEEDRAGLEEFASIISGCLV